MAAAKKFDLEKSLQNLEDLVEELESGDLPLEKAMKKFEEGIKLTRGCQTALKEAEQKVQVLLKGAGGDELAISRLTKTTEQNYSVNSSSSATTVDSTPAVTDGSGAILNKLE